MNFYSPLRYPGGKGKISNLIKKIFEENILLDGVYVEPYAGGASIALTLLFEEFASKIIINDFDRSIYAFWYCVLYDTERFCDLIDTTPINVESWQKQKKIQQLKTSIDLLQLGFSTFFLNRTNRSGIIKAGVIGGNNQEGNYKIDARFNKADLKKRILKIAQYRDRIELFNLDAIELINQIRQRLPDKTLIYFDPPYYFKGKDLYVNHYKHEDHVLVSEMITGLNEHRWLVSYDNTIEIKNLYNDENQFEYKLTYSLVNATVGDEVMFYHKDILIPPRTAKSTDFEVK